MEFFFSCISAHNLTDKFKAAQFFYCETKQVNLALSVKVSALNHKLMRNILFSRRRNTDNQNHKACG